MEKTLLDRVMRLRAEVLSLGHDKGIQGVAKEYLRSAWAELDVAAKQMRLDGHVSAWEEFSKSFQ